MLTGTNKALAALVRMIRLEDWEVVGDPGHPPPPPPGGPAVAVCDVEDSPSPMRPDKVELSSEDGDEKPVTRLKKTRKPCTASQGF